MKIIIDAMGGDNAPSEIVKGAVEATNENKDILVKLVGVEEQIKEELSKYKYNSDQLEIVNATEIIETGEPPVAAIREKIDSSLVKCLYMVNKYFITKDWESYRLDKDFILKVEALPSSECEIFEGQSPFTIIRVFTNIISNHNSGRIG